MGRGESRATVADPVLAGPRGFPDASGSAHLPPTRFRAPEEILEEGGAGSPEGTLDGEARLPVNTREWFQRDPVRSKRGPGFARIAPGGRVTPEIQILLGLQRIDRRLELLRRELEQRPRMHSEKKERLAAIEGKRGEIQGMQKDVQRRIDLMELEGKAIDAKVEESRRKLGQASTNTEYQGLLVQIARYQKERGVIDDQLLELWDEMEKTKALAKECDTASSEQRSVVEEEQGELDKELASIRKEARTLLAQREAARKPIDPELLAVYDALFARYRDRSVVSVEGGICGGCNMSLSPQTLADLKGTKPVHCNNCRRLLYPA